jgi:pyrroline-5-carboxylate reductase
MGSAMLTGWIETGTLAAKEIVVFDKDEAKVAWAAEKYGVDIVSGNLEAARESDIIFLAVKPQDADSVLGEISKGIRNDNIVVSIIAGLSTKSMRRKLGGDPSIIRVMPNLAALVGEAVSGYTLNPGTASVNLELPLRMLEAIGEAAEVEEEQLDLVTAVSGSGPAYFFLMAEVLEEAATRQGLSPDVARRLAEGTLWGAAKVLKEDHRDAAELRKAVSSPGGTTLAALEVLKENGFAETMFKAIDAARRRAGELSR